MKTGHNLPSFSHGWQQQSIMKTTAQSLKHFTQIENYYLNTSFKFCDEWQSQSLRFLAVWFIRQKLGHNCSLWLSVRGSTQGLGCFHIHIGLIPPFKQLDWMKPNTDVLMLVFKRWFSQKQCAWCKMLKRKMCCNSHVYDQRPVIKLKKYHRRMHSTWLIYLSSRAGWQS